MAASTVQNPQAAAESKSAKKKKAKAAVAAERTESPAPAATPDQTPSVANQDGASDEASDSPYLREIKKNIRNVNKKISAATKIEAITAQHKGKSIDELVSTKIINADQKAAYLKKSSLQSQLGQLEEQLSQFKKLDQDYRSRATTDKSDLEKNLTTKFEKEKAEAITELQEKSAADLDRSLRESLLVLSQFLRLAAARRAEEADAEADESLALEGVLLSVYSGDDNAVSTMIKLVQGSSEQTKNTFGESLNTTYAQVKAASVAHGIPLFQASESAQDTSETVESNAPPASDPTVVHAGLTEIDDGTAKNLVNGHIPDESHNSNTLTAAADVSDNAANEAGESQWDTGNELTMSQEWVDVKVPRDPAETETGLDATPAAATNTQSWADDAPEPSETPAVPTDPHDGFSQVAHRHRGQSHHEGGWHRGRGGDRGGYRGRGGFRGDGRGRGEGRGRGRGGRGGPRGGRGEGGGGGFRGGRQGGDES